MVVISGTLGVSEQASYVVIATIATVLYMVPLGIQEATCGIIGNCIGNSNVDLANRFFWLITKITFGLAIIISLVVLFCRNWIARCFTDDVTVKEIV